MSGYAWIAIDQPKDFDKLLPLLDEEFDPHGVVAKLKGAMKAAVRGILLEFEYVDKDYRSTFYKFYAKKGRSYREDCVRLHFFDGDVSFDGGATDLKWTVSAENALDDHYYGFIVLRPTIVATIGRSTLSPDIRQGARGQAIQARHGIHLLGHRLSVWGFPSMSQRNDISVCAHVSCWAILRHYSERFTQHRELLLHEITMLAKPFDPGGITPALGLTIYEAERIFQAAGTYPVIVAKPRREGDESDAESPKSEAAAAEFKKQRLAFYAQLLAYLESGFPLFAVMNNQQHAIVLAGYAWSPGLAPASAMSGTHAWDHVESLLAVDDNYLPYRCVPVETPAGLAEPGKYSVGDFDGFTVPLPEKIFYPASAVEKQSLAFHSALGKYIPMPAENDLVRRYFVTTVSALRRFARDRHSEFGEELVNMIMRLKTAQFVWMVEYASRDQWAAGHIAARVILDATASPRDPIPAWFAHGEQLGFHFDRSNALSKPTAVDLKRPAGTPLGRMEQNLRPIR